MFEGDFHFRSDTLAHAFFPENGHIHINDYYNWSLSFYPEPNIIILFYVILHEIGHCLGLNHINNRESIMYPGYITKGYDAFNFVFDSIDKELIKTMYSENQNTSATSTVSYPITTPVTEFVDAH